MKRLIALLCLFVGLAAYADCPTIIVPSAPAAAPPVPTSCGAATATWTSLTINTATATISYGSYAAYKLPLFPSPNKSENFNAVNAPNPGTVALLAQFTLSQCAGDFSVAKCTVSGYPENGAIKLSARTAAAEGAGCTIVTGKQYYLNVRNLNCPVGVRCSQIVQHHGG